MELQTGNLSRKMVKAIPKERHLIEPDLRDESHRVALACARGAIDKKGTQVLLLDIHEDSAFADVFVIVSASNDRQVRAIADSIDSEMSRLKVRTRSFEGMSDGRWVLLDYGDVIVHVFLEAIREYYDLEGIWSDVPAIQVPADYYYSTQSV